MPVATKSDRLPAITAPKVKNLTHIARLHKRNPDMGLIKVINNTQEKLNQYAADLAKDPTKTHTEKIKLLQQSGSKLSQSLLPVIDSYREGIQSRLAGYQSRIDGAFEIKGTTDLLILQSMGQATENMSASDVLALTSKDVDAGRAAILLPVVRYRYGLDKKPAMEAAIRDKVTRNVLADEFQQFESTREQLNEADNLGSYVMDVHTNCETEFRKITANEAVAPEA